MLLRIDSREPAALKQAAGIRAAKMGWDTEISALPVGDYQFPVGEGWAVVERKTVGDLISSVQDGRWADQLDRLTSSDTVAPIVMIEGLEAPFTSNQYTRGFTRQGIDGILFVAQLRGIYICLSEAGIPAVTNRLFALIDQLTDPNHASTIGGRKKVLEVDADEAARLKFLMGLPGLGERGARNLLKSYGSVLQVLEAWEEQPETHPLRQKYSRWVPVLLHQSPTYHDHNEPHGQPFTREQVIDGN